MLVLIDNYDSFTWNLVHCIGVLSPSTQVRVIRNEELSVGDILSLDPSHIVISPGPCTPVETGVCRDLVREASGQVPILGVCLGHQVIGDVHGMTVQQHDRPMHGKTSKVEHDGRGVFAGVESPIEVMRYHSLIVRRETVTPDFEISAWTQEDEVMALRWKGGSPDGPGRPMVGLQFHPESFMSPAGPSLVANFLQS